MSEIIGKRFRRNKYGLSLWEDRVREVIFLRNMPKDVYNKPLSFFKNMKKDQNLGMKLVPMVLGVNTLKAYSFDEIIFYND